MLSTCYVPGTVLSSEDTALNKSDRILPAWTLHYWWRWGRGAGRNTLNGKVSQVMLSATEKNKAVYWGGWLIMRREVAIICEVVPAGMWAGPRKNEGVSLSVWGRAFKEWEPLSYSWGNWGSKRFRSWPWSLSWSGTELVSRHRWPAPKPALLATVWDALVLPCQFHLHPVPVSGFCFHECWRQKSTGLRYATMASLSSPISDWNCSPLTPNRQ